MQEGTFHVKAYKKKELIKVLGIKSAYQFKKITAPHKEEIGKRMGHYYTPKQVRIIFEIVQAYKKKNAAVQNQQREG
jgi:hypothetical protein